MELIPDDVVEVTVCSEEPTPVSEWFESPIMEDMPDDVLLAVLQYVDVEDLFACRLVCKKLGALALHPDVWRHRQLVAAKAGLEDAGQETPVLRLAPCLREVCVDFPLDNLLFATTRCAVANMTLEVWSDPSLQAALVLRNQEALGRLKKAELVFCPMEPILNDIPWQPMLSAPGQIPWLVFWTAATCGLKTLVINMFPPSVPADASLFRNSVVPCSTLTEFQCEVSKKSEPFVNFVLAGHAATLEEVGLAGAGLPSSSTLTATLLAAAPNLARLQCALLPGLEALAESASLREVCLVVTSASDLKFLGPRASGLKPAVPAAAAFLRRADQLHKVALRIFAADAGLALVEALASCERSQVKTLALDLCKDGSFSWLQKLLEPLIALLALRCLKVQVSAWQKGDKGDKPLPCHHAWLHTAPVKRLMAANRRLRLVVCGFQGDTKPKYCSGDEPCDVCLLGCGTSMPSECTKLLARVGKVVGDSHLDGE
ncbi:uncharacterized protein LOC127752195 [Frankliniella occidentalis]|uniref:Uncharacterized protein LOC127752195 n=1 Tax=Frankliniella occidentalis TaxID=133901 RepID=A0A9C6XCZ1_FRAOC|nr:uncharacterized protein LOC127752195 [Frankliniella occidentalis]